MSVPHGANIKTIGSVIPCSLSVLCLPSPFCVWLDRPAPALTCPVSVGCHVGPHTGSSRVWGARGTGFTRAVTAGGTALSPGHTALEPSKWWTCPSSGTAHPCGALSFRPCRVGSRPALRVLRAGRDSVRRGARSRLGSRTDVQTGAKPTFLFHVGTRARELFCSRTKRLFRVTGSFYFFLFRLLLGFFFIAPELFIISHPLSNSSLGCICS